MIDPDNIITPEKNQNTQVAIQNLEPFEFLVWDTEDPKEFNKFIKQIEKEVRSSFEYREMISYLKSHYNMDQCAFIQIDRNDDTNISIEIHHYPFTLFDIVCIVYKKRVFYQESLEVEMVAMECTWLHYMLLVGLIPLSKTVHELVHDSKLFIPVQNTFGDYKRFVEIYKPFIDEETLETLDRIELYSQETSDLNTSTVLDMNTIHVNPLDKEFQIPQFVTIQDKMYERIDEIKKNGYHLPVLKDTTEPEVDRKRMIRPLIFIKEESGES